MSPFKALWQSRKFWLLVLDVVISTLVLVLTQFVPKVTLDFALKLVAIYQPLFVFVITGIFVEDAAAKSANGGSLPPVQ